MSNQIWFGMVHVKPKPQYQEQYNAVGGFNNVVGLANDEEEFVSRIKHYFEAITFDVDDVDVAFRVIEVQDIEALGSNKQLIEISDELDKLINHLSDENLVLGSSYIDSYYIAEVK